MDFLDVKRTVEKAKRDGKESVVLVFKPDSEYARNGKNKEEVKISDVANIWERDRVVFFDALGFELNAIKEISREIR